MTTIQLVQSLFGLGAMSLILLLAVAPQVATTEAAWNLSDAPE